MSFSRRVCCRLITHLNSFWERIFCFNSIQNIIKCTTKQYTNSKEQFLSRSYWSSCHLLSCCLSTCIWKLNYVLFTLIRFLNIYHDIHFRFQSYIKGIKDQYLKQKRNLKKSTFRLFLDLIQSNKAFSFKHIFIQSQYFANDCMAVSIGKHCR